MTRTFLTIALAAAAALAGCNKEDHNIVAGPDTGDDNASANAGVQLPPSIVATKLYRCADNSVVTVDYLSDNKTANVRPKEGAMAQVTTAEPGKPMAAAGGFSVEGSPTSATAKIAVPGHPAQTCKA
jgi:hypothetical protein